VKYLASFFVISATAFTLTGCCCDWSTWNCCDPCPVECCGKPCPEDRPCCCCPKPHVWDDRCCNPSNYDY